MTILIAGDDPGFRTVVQRLLEQGIAKRLFGVERETGVLVEVRDGAQAVRLTRELCPDIVLLDVAMRRCDSLAATRRIKSELPGAKVVIVTVHDAKAYPGAAADS